MLIGQYNWGIDWERSEEELLSAFEIFKKTFDIFEGQEITLGVWENDEILWYGQDFLTDNNTATWRNVFVYINWIWSFQGFEYTKTTIESCRMDFNTSVDHAVSPHN